ncbi:hypothetical protein [Desulfonatronum thioautotrophicum]|nr:hypothetical protein [Desulfonatronum thioautotrophicum]
MPQHRRAASRRRYSARAGLFVQVFQDIAKNVTLPFLQLELL